MSSSHIVYLSLVRSHLYQRSCANLLTGSQILFALFFIFLFILLLILFKLTLHFKTLQQITKVGQEVERTFTPQMHVDVAVLLSLPVFQLLSLLLSGQPGGIHTNFCQQPSRAESLLGAHDKAGPPFSPGCLWHAAGAPPAGLGTRTGCWGQNNER